MTQKESLVTRVVAGFEKANNRVVSLYNRTAKGPLHFFLGILVRLFSFYRNKIWNKFARNKENRYTKKRVSLTLAFTLFLLWLVPSMILTVWQGGLMATTWRNEVVFLTNAEEVDPLNEVHSVRGCRQIPCRESDAVYYRVRASWMHDGYSMFFRDGFLGGGWFYPEEVAGVVAPGVNRCEVVSYGIRIRALMRGWGIYPDMLDAVCTPYQVENNAAVLAPDA